jgi:hypothetical protein
VPGYGCVDNDRSFIYGGVYAVISQQSDDSIDVAKDDGAHQRVVQPILFGGCRGFGGRSHAGWDVTGNARSRAVVCTRNNRAGRGRGKSGLLRPLEPGKLRKVLKNKIHESGRRSRQPRRCGAARWNGIWLMCFGFGSMRGDPRKQYNGANQRQGTTVSILPLTQAQKEAPGVATHDSCMPSYFGVKLMHRRLAPRSACSTANFMVGPSCSSDLF